MITFITFIFDKGRALLFWAAILVPVFVWAADKPATPPKLAEQDRIRLAETYRLADSLGDQLWSGWKEIPFPVLLVTGDTEFLIRHAHPDSSFTFSGYDSLLKSKIYSRPRVFPPSLLASFPFDDLPTTVIGQAENTDAKQSTKLLWLLRLTTR